MCDVCKSLGLNTHLMNGDRYPETDARLYKVFSNRVAKIKVCRLHDIELFVKGEKKFMNSNIDFARALAASAKE